MQLAVIFIHSPMKSLSFFEAHATNLFLFLFPPTICEPVIHFPFTEKFCYLFCTLLQMKTWHPEVETNIHTCNQYKHCGYSIPWSAHPFLHQRPCLSVIWNLSPISSGHSLITALSFHWIIPSSQFIDLMAFFQFSEASQSGCPLLCLLTSLFRELSWSVIPLTP